MVSQNERLTSVLHNNDKIKKSKKAKQLTFGLPCPLLLQASHLNLACQQGTTLTFIGAKAREWEITVISDVWGEEPSK